VTAILTSEAELTLTSRHLWRDTTSSNLPTALYLRVPTPTGFPRCVAWARPHPRVPGAWLVHRLGDRVGQPVVSRLDALRRMGDHAREVAA